MSSWEEIANEVAPLDAPAAGLATGANRAQNRAASGLRAAMEAGQIPNAPSKPRVVGVPALLPGASLAQALGGVEVEAVGHGSFVSIARAPGFSAPEFDDLAARLQATLDGGKVYKLAGQSLRDLLFVDIETMGTSSDKPLFLLGTLHFAQNEARVEFFLARSLAEEGAALAAFHRLARGKYLLTFNGKSFDWPYIAARSRRLGLVFSEPTDHLDTLALSRRLWRGEVPNCRLQTLETFICGRVRDGDVPSSMVPSTYAASLNQADPRARARTLAPVVHHNALDVLSMAELVAYAGEGQTWRQRWPEIA